jgi:hypothetical protein
MRPSIGSFSDFSDSFVGYGVKEQLAGIGPNTTVGRTPDVPGSLTLAGTTITDVASTSIVFADFGFQGPSSFAVLSVEDHGVMEFQLLFRHG